MRNGIYHGETTSKNPWNFIFWYIISGLSLLCYMSTHAVLRKLSKEWMAAATWPFSVLWTSLWAWCKHQPSVFTSQWAQPVLALGWNSTGGSSGVTAQLFSSQWPSSSWLKVPFPSARFLTLTSFSQGKTRLHLSSPLLENSQADIL